MNTSIRMITDLPQSAQFNMAADMHLLCAAPNADTVFLRFYTWARPSITIGCTQSAAEVLDRTAMENDHVDWIRRPTGGRAVLHQEDLTYSIVFGKQHKIMGGNIAESYHLISRALIAGLTAAGVPCTPHDSPLDAQMIKREKKLPCFLAPNRDEIMVGARKLIGSAQKRTAHAVLQHGSIPLTSAFRNLPRYSAVSAAQREQEQHLFESKCTCVSECLPHPDINTLIETMAQAFAAVTGLPLIRQQWSANEQSQIAERIASPLFATEFLA